MYRVFSCGGGSTNDIVLQALIDAIHDGADIISMSLSATTLGFERRDVFGDVIANAKKLGVAVIAAAGNAGWFGPFNTPMPAISKDAVAVASVDSARYPTTYKVGSNRGGEWRYSSLWPLDGEFTVYAIPSGSESSDCDPSIIEEVVSNVNKNGWDIATTYVMFRQSERRCSVQVYVDAINNYGFYGALAWRDREFGNPYDNNFINPSSLFPRTISMDHVDGPKLYDAINADPLNFRLRFSDRRFLAVDNPSAGFTSNFSTIGNTWEYSVFKPLLSAPGHLILSTWPLEGDGYAILSGTSMCMWMIRINLKSPVS